MLFTYVFGPFDVLPDAASLDELEPIHAPFIGKVGSMGLAQGRWPVLGRGRWLRDDWPLIPLSNVDPILGRVRRVEYAEGDLLHPIVWRVVDDPMLGAPEDSLYGYLALEIHLAKIFGATT